MKEKQTNMKKLLPIQAKDRERNAQSKKLKARQTSKEDLAGRKIHDQTCCINEEDLVPIEIDLIIDVT